MVGLIGDISDPEFEGIRRYLARHKMTTREQLFKLHRAMCTYAFLLMQSKNRDYAGQGEDVDALANFREDGLPGIITRMGDKRARMKTYAESGEYKTRTESFLDTAVDAINYPVLAAAWVAESTSLLSELNEKIERWSGRQHPGETSTRGYIPLLGAEHMSGSDKAKIRAVARVEAERNKISKHKDKGTFHNFDKCVAVLTEELGEVAKESIDYVYRSGHFTNPPRLDALKTELAQVVAFASLWLQNLEERSE